MGEAMHLRVRSGLSWWRVPVLIVVLFVAAGCGASSAAPAHPPSRVASGAPQQNTPATPDAGAQPGAASTPAGAAPAATVAQRPASNLPPVLFTTAAGATVPLYVEIADTPPDLALSGKCRRCVAPRGVSLYGAHI